MHVLPDTDKSYLFSYCLSFPEQQYLYVLLCLIEYHLGILWKLFKTQMDKGNYLQMKFQLLWYLSTGWYWAFWNVTLSWLLCLNWKRYHAWELPVGTVHTDGTFISRLLIQTSGFQVLLCIGQWQRHGARDWLCRAHWSLATHLPKLSLLWRFPA